MSESMNIEKKDNLVVLGVFFCVLLLKVCILGALFSAYSAGHSTPLSKESHKLF